MFFLLCFLLCFCYVFLLCFCYVAQLATTERFAGAANVGSFPRLKATWMPNTTSYKKGGIDQKCERSQSHKAFYTRCSNVTVVDLDDATPTSMTLLAEALRIGTAHTTRRAHLLREMGPVQWIV
jgi:hypothetical protein